MIGDMVALYVIASEISRSRKRRRIERFNRYMIQLHSRPVDMPITFSHFLIGKLYARYGTSKQLDDWYRLMHGWP